jgi:hypothetical protein
MKVNGKTISFTVEVIKNCVMVVSTKDSGLKDACMEEDFTFGQMERSMKVNTV